MTSGAVAVIIVELVSSALLPGPAEGEAALRYADVQCSLAPPLVKRGQEATLTVRLTPRAGVTWHEAKLVPGRVEIRPAAGWESETSELALPAPEGPSVRREVSFRLRAGERASGYGALEIRIRYGVRLARPIAPPVEPDDFRAASSGQRSGPDREEDGGVGPDGPDGEAEEPPAPPEPVPVGVVFEEATLTLDLPAASAAPPAARSEEGGQEGVGREWPRHASADGGAPSLRDALLPAAFLALATVLAFLGVAVWIRARRLGR